jgi:D-alanyl-D-alanine dipeptidase
VIAALATLLLAAVPGGSRQLVLVTTAGWDAPEGQLTRWERAEGKSWKQVGPPVAVVVGAAGLGWGRGLHAGDLEGPTKREGDRRAPAGVFTLGPAWGYAEQPEEGVRWPYNTSTAKMVCVDDARDASYNRIVEGPRTWMSAERMRQSGEAYRWLVVVEHNFPPMLGAGSCTFLHAFGRKRGPTRGCTAMDQTELRGIIKWLRPEARPVLVQAPLEVVRSQARAWGAPVPPN